MTEVQAVQATQFAATHQAPPSTHALSELSVPAFNTVAPVPHVVPDHAHPTHPFLCILPLPDRVPFTKNLYQFGWSIQGLVIVRLL